MVCRTAVVLVHNYAEAAVQAEMAYVGMAAA